MKFAPRRLSIACIFAMCLYLSGCHQLLQDAPAPSKEEASVPTVPPPPPVEAYLGKVSPTVLNKISHMPVMAPAYIPAGFVLADYRFEGSQSYDLIYRSPENLCFVIEYRLQQPPVDDVAGLTTQEFNSPAFGSNRKLYYRNLESQAESKAASQSLDELSRPNQLFSQWLSRGSGSYRFAGAAIVGQNYPNQQLCQNVSLIEANKIVTSIADLTASSSQ